MIQKDLQQLSTTRRDLRKFGLVVGGVFLLLGGWFLFRRKPAWPYFVTPGVLLVSLGFIAPRLLKTVYVAWMGLAFTLGLVVSTVILTLFYFLVITPLALVGRFFGKDFLSEKLDPEAKSYWLRRDLAVVRQPADYEKQDLMNQTSPPPCEPPRSRLKTWLQNLALMVGTFGLCFIVLEVSLRIAGYGNVEIYQPDPLLYWKLKPNQNCYTKIDRKPVHVNSHGTRGPEFQTVKPANTFRILSLGDSKTFGWGLSEAESYSGLIGKMLQQHVGGGKKVEVINAGVNAWSYAQMHAYFREYGLKYQPDVVILADANLWTQFSDKNSPEFVQTFMRRVWLKNFLRRFATYHYIVEYKLKEVYERQRTRFIPMDPRQDTFFKEQQAADPDAFFRDHIAGLCSLAVSNGVKPVLLHMPTLGQLNDPESNNVIKAKTLVSHRLGVPLVDMTPDMKPGGKTLFIDGDEAHLNVSGNGIVAQRLFNSLTNLVVP